MFVRRAVFLVCAVAVMLLGLASRRYRAHLPEFLAEYSGDTLWALMLFLLVSTTAPHKSIRFRWSVTALLALTIEVSQLYHAPWIDGIRQTTLGGLVLGHGFLWSDLVCYTVGITLGALAESTLNTLAAHNRHTVLHVKQDGK